MGGLLQPGAPLSLSLEQGLVRGLIDTHTRQYLSELESALLLVENTKSTGDQQQNVLPVATAMEFGLIREEVGLRILELEMNTGGLRDSAGKTMSLEQAGDMRLLPPRTLTKLQSRLQHRELINPNTAEKLNLYELQQHCVLDDDSGLLLLPVKQQPGGTVCLRSGRKVGIFRAVQEGLIDRKVTVRLLEAQLFAGGIADPRSGHRLTVDEAVRHGLMDQDLACAMLARQLQNGGILDPLSGERLGLEESIRRDLLSSRLALLVLESLWTFMGMLLPESGELLSIVEALQQGVISGELASNILRQRHAIGALYDPETLQVLPLNQTAEEVLEPSVVSSLKDIHIPDVLPNMNQSGTPSLNRLSWGSTSSSPSPSSPPPSSSPTGMVWDATPTDGMDPEEQAKHKLLFHLMTHSYVDAHSGKRLVLLDPELVDLVKAAELVAGDSVYVTQVEPLSSLATDKQGKLQMVSKFSLTEKGVSDNQTVVEEESSNVVTPSNDFDISGTGSLEGRYDGENDKLQHKPSVIVESGLAFTAKDGLDKDVKDKKKEKSDLETSVASVKNLNEELTKGPDEQVATKSTPLESGHQKTRSTTTTVDTKTVTAPLKSEEDVRMLKEPISVGAETNDNVNSTQSEAKKDIKHSQTESEMIKQKVPITIKHAEPQVDILESGVEKEEEAELAELVLELKRGGLMTEEGEKLLPDEAVAQGVLPGHTAVKLMAQAGLFGGFLDASSGESLSMEDVMQEGLLDEDLMWGVLKSDKTLAGVVDVEKRQICGVREAAQAGLIDSNTAARLLEAQVASGGIVDIRRDKKVSVTLASNLGLIEDDQREGLVALEKAYKGKDTDSAATLTKASLQLQIEGVIDPESKSPVPLEQAIQKGLISPEEAYQVLARQVAEGGIIHHASGIRLSVSDAVDRGLVDRSIAPGLEELEWVYQGKVSPSSHPEAVILQASTGAIFDPDSGCKLTLTEAVSKGLLAENIASEAMASLTVTQGALDPQAARIVPYSQLVSQGKIDIETGKRFLEVKPFRGVQNEQTRDRLTLPEAVASKQVDPVPALRLLQSQADSGGIIDITNGERLPLPEAFKRGLVGEDMARVIATNQIVKGGLVDPATGQRVSSVNDAIAVGLISRDMASEIQEKLPSAEIEVDEDSSTPVASSLGTYSPSVTLPISSPDSSANWSDVNTELLSRSPISEKGLTITQGDGKTLTSVVSDQSLFYDTTTEEDKVEAPVSEEEEAVIEPDQSIDLLCKFATNVEKRIQQTIEELAPQKDIKQSEHPPKPDERLQIDESNTDDKQQESISRYSVGEFIQEHVFDTDDDKKEEVREVVIVKSDGEKECRSGGESTSMVHVEFDEPLTGFITTEIRDDRENKHIIELLSEEEYRKSDVALKMDDGNGKREEKEKPIKIEIKASADVEQSDQLLTTPVKETESKSKKKRKNKKKGKGKEAESETQPPEIKDPSEIDQVDAEIEGQPEATDAFMADLALQNKYKKSQIHGQAASVGSPKGNNNKAKTDGKIEGQNDLVKQEPEALPLTLKFTEPKPEKDAIQLELPKDTEKGDKREEKKWEKQGEEVEEKDFVSQQSESSHEVEKSNEQELPQKSSLPDDEKAALILKAKESILKKVFEKAVSEKQAAEELQALRKEVGKKEIHTTTVKDGKVQTLPAKVDEVESHDVKDDSVKRSNGSPKESEEETSVKEDKMEKLSVKEGTETKLLEASNESKKNKGFVEEDVQKDVETAPSVQPKEIQQSKRSKKKKSKSPKVTDKAQAGTDKLLTDDKLDSEVMATKISTKSTTAKPDLDSTAEQTSKHTDGQSTSEVIKRSVGEKENQMETSAVNVNGAETCQQRSSYLSQSEEPSSHIEEQTQMEKVTSMGKEVLKEPQESHSENRNAAESIDYSHETQPAAQSVIQPEKTTGKGKKKKGHQSPEVESTNVPESKSLKEQQHLKSAESVETFLSEDASTESESAGVPESDTATESWGEEEDDVREIGETVSNKEATTVMTGKVRSSRKFDSVFIFHIDLFKRNTFLWIHRYTHLKKYVITLYI